MDGKMDPELLLEELGNLDLGLHNFTNGSLFDPTPVVLPPSLKLFREVIRWMEYVILPTIIIMGLLGNGISFLVFTFSHLRRLSASVYLAALSLANAGFLMIRFIKWIHSFKLLLNTETGCQTFLYMFHVFRFLSVWYVVSFTVERYIAVCQPFQRQHMCTPRRAKIVVIVLAILSLVIYSFVTWTSGVQKVYDTTECLPKTNYLNMWTFIYGLDMISTLVVPTVAIFILNILITRDVRRLHRNPVHANTTLSYRHVKVLTRRHSTSTTNCCYKPRKRQTLRTCSGPQAFQGKVTKMLVTVSTTFLLFNLPIHTLTVYHHIQSKILGPGRPPSHTFLYLQHFFLLIHDSNFAVNFIIYICGRNFRLGLKHLWKRVRYNIYRCRHPYYRHQTPGTTVTAVPQTNRVYLEHPAENQSNNLTNGVHFRLQRVQSRSTSSSSKSYMSSRSRARMLAPSYRREPPEHS